MSRLRVRVTPRASRTAVAGRGEGDVLRIRIAAPPADGAANATLVRFVAELLGIAAGRVRIAQGAGAREKTLEIDGLGEPELKARLDALEETGWRPR